MIASGVARRFGNSAYARSQGCGKPGMCRSLTMKPQMPACVREPLPVAASSRISPPTPVAAPGNGEIAVGWLCVSTFISWSSWTFLKP